MISGWAKFQRALLDADWWESSRMVHVFATLLLMSDISGRAHVSINDLCRRTKQPRSTVRSCLKKLEQFGVISQEIHAKDRYIYIQDMVNEHSSPQPQHQEQAKNDYFERMKNAQAWKEDMAMKYHKSTDEIEKLIDAFALDCRCNDKHHQSESEARRHFVNWLNKQAELRNNEKIKNDKNERYDRRRAYEVHLAKPEEYEGRF